MSNEQKNNDGLAKLKEITRFIESLNETKQELAQKIRENEKGLVALYLKNRQFFSIITDLERMVKKLQPIEKVKGNGKEFFTFHHTLYQLVQLTSAIALSDSKPPQRLQDLAKVTDKAHAFMSDFASHRSSHDSANQLLSAVVSMERQVEGDHLIYENFKMLAGAVVSLALLVAACSFPVLIIPMVVSMVVCFIGIIQGHAAHNAYEKPTPQVKGPLCQSVNSLKDLSVFAKKKKRDPAIRGYLDTVFVPRMPA